MSRAIPPDTLDQTMGMDYVQELVFGRASNPGEREPMYRTRTLRLFLLFIALIRGQGIVAVSAQETEVDKVPLGFPVATEAQEWELLEARAIPNHPMGVATLLIALGNIDVEELPRLHLSEANGRVLYPSYGYEALPVLRNEPRRLEGLGLREALRRAIQSGRDALQPPQGLRISFLFRGDEPLDLRIRGDVSTELVLQVDKDQKANYQADFGRWWKIYANDAKVRLSKADYPPLVETYLTSMLAGRFNLPFPELRADAKKKLEEPMSTLVLLANTEEIRRECLIEAMKPKNKAPSPLEPLPAAPICAAPEPPELPSNLPIESIASVVPPECFYLRFGTFSNYLWYDQLSSRRGGDLAQLAMMRGFNYETDIKLEKLLNTKMTTLTKLFGETVLSDMAVIGRDLYVQEGPTLGVVLEAKNSLLLRNSLAQERSAAAKQGQSAGVRLDTIEILGRKVSFLHSPDHSVRSFLVEHDRYFFITTSKHLVERFLQVADGAASLASTNHFRFSRLLLPEKNGYTIFAYLSPEFFRGLIAPEYQIELRRRLVALGHLEMAEMARYVAKAEKSDARSIEEYIREGYLPQWFHERTDGTRTLFDGDKWIDSLRGARGSFLPIADVEIGEVSREEADRYRQQAKFYERDWKQTDPMVIGLRRFSHPDQQGLERVTLEAYVAPFGKEKYGWLSNQLAPPIDMQIRLPAEDVASVQVHLAGNSIGRRVIPDHVLFLGLKDMVPPKHGDTTGLIQTLRTLKETPAYLGAWPRPGYLDMLPLGIGGGPPDAVGFSKLLLGLWRWQGGGFSVLSFDRSILDDCVRQLTRIPAKDPAQARLKIGNLGGSRLSEWVNSVWYKKGVATTMGNARLLDAIHQQFHVPQEEALTVVQRLLNCKLQCPFGGEYLCEDGGEGVWNSSKVTPSLREDEIVPPPGYQAPWLEWFRGGEVHFTQLSDRLVLMGQFDVQPLPPHPKSPEMPVPLLPKMNFNLFDLPFQKMNGEKVEATQEKKDPERRGF